MIQLDRSGNGFMGQVKWEAAFEAQVGSVVPRFQPPVVMSCEIPSL